MDESAAGTSSSFDFKCDVSGLGLAVAHGRAVLRLRAEPDPAVHERLGAALGMALPPACRMATADEVSAVWLAPAEWLVLCERDKLAHVQTILEVAAARDFVSMVDLTDARLVLVVSGGAAREFLSQGCTLDLHRSCCLPGDAAVTRFAGLTVLLACTGDDRFELYFDTSYRGFVAAWMRDASRSWRLA